MVGREAYGCARVMPTCFFDRSFADKHYSMYLRTLSQLLSMYLQGFMGGFRWGRLQTTRIVRYTVSPSGRTRRGYAASGTGAGADIPYMAATPRSASSAIGAEWWAVAAILYL